MRLSHKLALAGAGMLCALLFLALIEGLCGPILVIRGAKSRPKWINSRGEPASAREDPIMGREDPVIGHTLQPNLLVRYAHAPDDRVQTNSQGFRNDVDFPAAAPQGRLRILCSGDSMTFGLGVSNGETWPDQLAAIDPRIETVNMGQSRYGIDQMYLWYMRAGAPLEHAVHIVALIPLDVSRLDQLKDGFLDRPRLDLHEGRLEVANRPVHNPWYRYKLQSFLAPFQELHIVKLFRSNASALTSRPEARPQARPEARTEAQRASTQARLIRILEELAQTGRAKGSVLVVVLLPNSPRVAHPQEDEPLRRFLARQLPSRGIVFLDLDAEMWKLPLYRLRGLFIPDRLPFTAHYTAEGGAYVAGLLHAKLIALPQIASRLKACKSPGPRHLSPRALRAMR